MSPEPPRPERQAPRPTRLQGQVRNILRRAHLLCLTGIACYLAYHYENSSGVVAMLLAAAYVTEIAPPAWRKRYFSEILFVVIGIITFAWARALDAGFDLDAGLATDKAFGGWLRMLLAHYVLIPARFGMLRHIAALAATELLIAGHRGDGFWSYLVLVPGVLVCLALDNWTQSMHNPLGRQVAISSTATRLKTGLLGAVVASCALVVFLLGAGLSRLATAHWDREGGILPAPPGNDPGDLARRLSPRDDIWNSRSPKLVARLDTAERPSVDARYLRALCVPRIELDPDDGTITWTSRERADRRLAEDPVLHGGHTPVRAELFRAPGNPGVVLVPDGCSRVWLDRLLADLDGNLYRRDIGQFSIRYGVDAGAGAHPVADWAAVDRSELLYVPSRVSYLLEQEVGNLERWRQLPAHLARSEVIDFLRRRCTYTLDTPPAPVSGEGACILRFILGETDERCGHCQLFSTAAVVLLRLAGHPARPVVGFASDQIDASGVTFRELHAHAWAEVLDDRNHWLRVDPTPPAHLAMRREGVGLGEDWDRLRRTSRSPAEIAEERAASASGWRGDLVIPVAGILLLVGIGLVIYLHHRRHRPDPRRRILARQAEDLVSLAVSLGLRVEQHDTIATVVGRLQAEVDLDLEPPLRRYQEARFARGDIPPSWPLKEIRQSARRAKAVPRPAAGKPPRNTA